MNTLVQQIDISNLTIGLIGGLALFLFGMEQMSNALKAMTGTKVKGLLKQITANPAKGVLAGAFVTAIFQSSSVTTVLLVGFVSAGLLTVQQSIGMIIGAGIGTTVTAQIIAFDITEYALLLVAVGFMMKLITSSERVEQYGIMILGVGLVFFGITLMSHATDPLRSYQPFINLMLHLENPLYAILVGTCFTAVIQSSAATIALVMVLASHGFLTLEVAIALTLGANIGTCSTALLASIGRRRVALQTALAHIIIITIGVILWYGFIEQLADLARWFSPAFPNLSGTKRIAAEVPRQIANAHTLFNVANAILFIAFTHQIANLMQSIAPEKPEETPTQIKPKYLDQVLMETPELALDRVRMELINIGTTVQEMVQKALPAATIGSRKELTALAELDDRVDVLHSDILAYLANLSRRKISEAQTQRISAYIAIANIIENIGDLIETNIVHTGLGRLKNDVRMSDVTLNILSDLHEAICQTLDTSLKAVNDSSNALAEEVSAAKKEINLLTDRAEQHLTSRLRDSGENKVVHFRLESELIGYFKRVYYLSSQIALQVGKISPKG